MGGDGFIYSFGQTREIDIKGAHERGLGNFHWNWNKNAPLLRFLVSPYLLIDLFTM